MITTIISLYDKPSFVKSNKEIPFDIFLDGIRKGTWEDFVHKVRRLPYGSPEWLDAKKQVPSVTIAGKFKQRYDKDVVRYSGYMAIDIDKDSFPDGLTADEFKQLICADRYVQSAFLSISGYGLCVIFRVNGEKYKEAYRGACEYMYETYRVTCDPTSVNPSRARFVSYDPDIYINHLAADKFTRYPKEKEIPKQFNKVVYDKDDFSYLLEQIVERKVNLVENYYEWLRVGFGIAHKFGEGGRQYYHIVSQYSSKYDPAICDRQFTACLKANGQGTTTISTLYYYAKQAGLQVYSEKTKQVIRITGSGKKAGLKPEQISKNLKEHAGIEDVDDLVKQSFEGGVELEDDTLIDELEMFLRQSYELRRNVITRYIENKGVVLKQKDLNSIFIKSKRTYDKTNYELVDRLINSDFVVDYNPFLEFFERHLEDYPYDRCQGTIAKAFDCIKTKDAEYCRYFGTKWVVGMISSIYGVHSPLMLVLSGNQHGTGKTEWFRRLLPKELLAYYAESKLDAGKDDYILMTQKLLIMDDEYGGKSKREYKMLKDVLSKQWFSLREPYGKNNVDLLRLATLGATSNDDEILWDPTQYQRRIIPIQVIGKIDNKTYNEIDKIALFMEAYYLFHSGFDWTVVSDADIHWLGQDAASFEVSSLETDLILKYFEPCTDATAEKLTTTEIKVILEDASRQKLILDKLGKELRKLGFLQVHVRTAVSTRRCYLVRRIIHFGPELGVDRGMTPDEPPF